MSIHEVATMTRFYVKVIPEKSKPGLELYLTKRFREGHDGPYTESFHNAQRWGTAAGPENRIWYEKTRQPNLYYGHLTFEVVEEDTSDA